MNSAPGHSVQLRFFPIEGWRKGSEANIRIDFGGALSIQLALS